MKILHTADFHINSIQSGRWDPSTGLPVRMMDFLKSLDKIIDIAIEEEVDLFLFAGDAYKDRNPTPRHQAEFASRILRLEDAEIQTFLLIGNHDMSSSSHTNALMEFITWQPNFIQVVGDIYLHKSEAFDMVCLPWIHKSQLVIGKVIQQLEELIEKMNPDTPNIFLGHCSVVGAQFSSERLVMLGEDLMLPLKLLTESGFDYVALGHIHKHQVLVDVENAIPVVYPGSIERVDWGEAGEDKGFMMVDINEKGGATVEFIKLDTRPMIDCSIELKNKDEIYKDIQTDLVNKDPFDCMIRIKLQYPENWAGLINNQKIENMFPDAFSVHIVHDPIREGRTRLDLDQDIAAYTPQELLQMWLEEKGIEDQDELLILAKELFGGSDESVGKSIHA